MSDSTRVVLLSLDSFQHDAITPELTPSLWNLAKRGGMAPDGGRCDLPSVTYVSHATLATGTHPATHRLRTNRAARPTPGAIPGWAGADRVRVPTLFDAMHAAGLPAASVCGDQYLVRIMEAERGGTAWPPGGVLPPGTATCASGYAANAAVRGPLLDAVKDPRLALIFGHFNEVDTLGHHFGPDDRRTLDGYRGTDRLVGESIEALEPDWRRTVLIVLSDHGMELVTGEPVDLRRLDPEGLVIAEIVNDGGAALVRLGATTTVEAAGDWLRSIEGVAGCEVIGEDVLLVAGAPGAVFSSGSTKHNVGMHGGPGATRTLAIVGGGHPVVKSVAADIARRPPHLADWAPTIAAILGAAMPTAEGRNLAS